MQAEQAGEKTGHVTTGDGVRLFFEMVGDGPAPVLIPNGFYYHDEFARFAEDRTVVFFDLRNRGMSDAVSDMTRLEKGVWNDVEDLEAVRRHFGFAQVALIGHSYVGLTVLLYAMKYPDAVGRVVSLSPAPPDAAKQYPAELSAPNDGVMQVVFAKLGELQKERGTYTEEEFCRKCWSILGAIYVADPAHAEKIVWGRCELVNERDFLKYWSAWIYPSLKALRIGAEDFAKVSARVLVVHGTKDRSAPYGGAREWTMKLPNARLLTLENVAHAPWVEAPETVFGALERFLAGAWPDGVEQVEAL